MTALAADASPARSEAAAGRLPLVLVAAVAGNGVIGQGGGLPWHVPEDLALFRGLTMGRPMLMGRRTFLSLGRVLDGRPHVVLTRDADWSPPRGCAACPDLETALADIDRLGRCNAADYVAVIGGAEVFEATLPLASRLLITEIDAQPPGDARFPAFDVDAWPVVRTETWRRSAASGLRYRLLDRRRA